jgi:hypothetical protein
MARTLPRYHSSSLAAEIAQNDEAQQHGVHGDGDGCDSDVEREPRKGHKGEDAEKGGGRDTEKRAHEGPDDGDDNVDDAPGIDWGVERT